MERTALIERVYPSLREHHLSLSLSPSLSLDTVVERTALIERVYPSLREHYLSLFLFLSLDTAVERTALIERMYPSLREHYLSLFLFLSLDTVVERTALIERVYPSLREHYLARGYELQLMDLNWGQRDLTFDDHSAAQLSTELVQQCLDEHHGLALIVRPSLACPPR